MANRTYYLIVGTSNTLNAGLPITARSVAVDNPTDSYVHILTADFYVPPHTSGWVIPFPQATVQGNVKLEAPVGQTNVLTTGQIVTLIFSDQPSSFVGGTTSAVQAATVSGTVVSAPPANRIRTIAGGSVGAHQNATVGIGSVFSDPLLWALVGNLASFNCTVAGCYIGAEGQQTFNIHPLLNFVTPGATNLLWTSPVGTTWNTPIDLRLVFPGDTSWLLTVTIGPSTTDVDVAVTGYLSQ